MGTFDLSRYQAGLLAFYSERLKQELAVSLFDFTYAAGDVERERVVKVARFPLVLSDNSLLWMNCTLGEGRSQNQERREHEHQFVGLYDSDSLALGELVGSLYHFDATISTLADTHTVPIGGASMLHGLGYTASLILRGSYYVPFGVPVPRLGDTVTSLFAVQLITDSELAVKKTKGTGELLQKWRADKRDRFHVGDRKL